MEICSVCGCSNSAIVYEQLRKCERCGFIWADLSISDLELQRIYSEAYFSGEEYYDYLSEEPVLKIGFKRVFHHLLKYLRVTSTEHKPRLLEIGCAYGFFLDVASGYFDATGIEISQDAVEHALSRGHKVIAGDFLSIAIEENRFDAVVSLATLEHIQHPGLYLKKIASILRPGGIFYCTTIDIESRFARMCGSRWRMIHPPTHMSYFSAASLCDLARRHRLEPLECKPIWQFRGLDILIAPLLVRNRSLARVYSFIRKTPVKIMAIPFNFGDIIALTASKMAA